jgi:TonB family protein
LNLIALMQTPAPSAPAYLLQTGNRLAEAQPGPNSPSQAASGRNGSPAANTDASETPKDAPQATGAEASANARLDASGAETAPSKGTYADLLAASSPGSTGKGSLAADSNAGQAGEQERRKPSGQSYPSGNLGVIIVQQSAQDTILEGSEILTGQPVYTVYFDVPGAPRRWILQYCLPGSDSKTFLEQPDGVIRILPKRSVQPPFPIERIPLDVKSLPNPGTPVSVRRLVIYATVNERGETGNVRLIRGTGQEIDRAAVATLQRWTFRPAMRGDTPVAVEALFGIPLP